jgi:hypothetical protein
MSIITIESPGPNLSDAERTALVEADIITGVDAEEREFTVFGTPPLESTVSLRRPAAMRVVQVRIDGPAGLATLTALVRSVKGMR